MSNRRGGVNPPTITPSVCCTDTPYRGRLVQLHSDLPCRGGEPLAVEGLKSHSDDCPRSSAMLDYYRMTGG